MNKTEYELLLEGYEEISFNEMLALIQSGRRILLTSLGDQLYWRPQWPKQCESDKCDPSNIQTRS